MNDLDRQIADTLMEHRMVDPDMPYQALLTARMAIAKYEYSVPSDRLREILAARRVAVHDLVRTDTRQERHEPRACEVCGEPIEPGEAYTPTGPAHARHTP